MPKPNKTAPRTERPITAPVFLRQHILRMTVTQFAAALGVDQSVISRYEDKGLLPEHHHKTVIKLAKARKIRVRPEWFTAVPWDPRAGVPA